MKLPVVGEYEIGGQTFRVHAIPYGVAKLAAKADAGEEALAAFLAAVWEKCVTTDAEKPSVDDIPLAALNDIVEIASGKTNFRTSPPTSGSGG